MKKIFFLLIALLFTFSCKDEVEDIYDGGPLLQFSEGVSNNGLVPIGAGSATYKITYGVVKQVTSNHSVKLVFDAANSTAVEGVDFQILNGGTDEITTGEVKGSFDVKVLEANLTTIPKTAVFKLQSATIPNAGFAQSYTLNLSLKCPLDTFFSGGFNNVPAFWNAPSGSTNGGQFLIETDSSQPGKLFVRDFLDIGIDMEIAFNASETEFTVVDKFTGSSTPFGGATREIWVRQRSGTSNTVDVCGRSMKLMTQYYLRDTTAAYSGDTSETFTGL